MELQHTDGTGELKSYPNIASALAEIEELEGLSSGGDSQENGPSQHLHSQNYLEGIPNVSPVMEATSPIADNSDRSLEFSVNFPAKPRHYVLPVPNGLAGAARSDLADLINLALDMVDQHAKGNKFICDIAGDDLALIEAPDDSCLAGSSTSPVPASSLWSDTISIPALGPGKPYIVSMDTLWKDCAAFSDRVKEVGLNIPALVTEGLKRKKMFNRVQLRYDVSKAARME
ncbi:phosphoprotein [Wufeng Myotis altarium vesiculovirus 1]|uniref:phosphoprotein n=1 Tax=Wufeng Myotis altarium vesiculovirus 1 TaxID=2929011 RepID=UPI002481B2E8|nr:phosphoprotein [Wufeng Myotis altarium vesiculovirus 1]UOX72931.1 phosphoprotein [Wufeng Myotis altarium vesiculovirus 1]